MTLSSGGWIDGNIEVDVIRMQRNLQPTITCNPSVVSGDSDMLLPKKTVDAQWWYYHGHLLAGSNRYSFHVAFFRYDSRGVRIGRIFPLKILGDEVDFAHASLTDHQAGQTWFAHQKSFRRRGVASTGTLAFEIGEWTLRVDDFSHQLQANLGEVSIDLELQPSKPMTVYGQHGLFGDALPRKSSYCCYPRMKADGEIHTPSGTLSVSGDGWMDREFGQIGPDSTVAGWDWMAIQFDDDSELMLYWMLLRENSARKLRGALIDRAGQHQILTESDISLQPTEYWRSAQTGAKYPTCWSVLIPKERIDVEVRSCFDEAEFDTRGSTSIFYREGPAEVSGLQAEKRICGRAFMESVGHDTKWNLGCYNAATQNMPLLGYLRNEMRSLLPGSSTSFTRHNQ